MLLSSCLGSLRLTLTVRCCGRTAKCVHTPLAFWSQNFPGKDSLILLFFPPPSTVADTEGKEGRAYYFRLLEEA